MARESRVRKNESATRTSTFPDTEQVYKKIEGDKKRWRERGGGVSREREMKLILE